VDVGGYRVGRVRASGTGFQGGKEFANKTVPYSAVGVRLLDRNTDNLPRWLGGTTLGHLVFIRGAYDRSFCRNTTAGADVPALVREHT